MGKMSFKVNWELIISIKLETVNFFTRVDIAVMGPDAISFTNREACKMLKLNHKLNIKTFWKTGSAPLEKTEEDYQSLNLFHIQMAILLTILLIMNSKSHTE